MTTTPELTDTEIAIKDLALHDLNARAGSPETYEADDIPVLAASIATLGLLNPLIVHKTGKVWGVIAGGRRRAALIHLVNDAEAKGWTMRTKVRCRALPDDIAAATAITVAENVTQKAMDPLDEFEAFARMMETGGHDPDGIARMFGVERRRVIDRLRFGRVHPDIRAAARAREITLDAMKAFAEHPDQAVQKDVFDAMQGSTMQAWTIRDKLRNRGVKMGDAVARLVADAYRAAGGDIAADLIAEDSILTDETLVEKLLMETLAAHAEAERARLGFAWAQAVRAVDYKVLQEFGRVYPGAVDPVGEDAARCEAIANRLAELDEAREAYEAPGAEDCPDIEALDIEYDTLTDEYESLTTGWAEADLGRAGVLAYWDQGRIATAEGLVRPEDRADRQPVAAGGDGGGAATGNAGEGEAGNDALELPESLRIDLRTEQAAVIGSALAADPDLAHDLLLFKTISDLLGRSRPVTYSFGVTASAADRPHGKPEEVDGRPAEALAELYEGLDLRWWADGKSMPERFEAFRAVDPGMKSRIVAVALADAVKPTSYGLNEGLMAHVARQLVPDLRAVWRPTGGAFFGRLKKSVLLGLIARDLAQPEEAARLATEKKTAIVDFLERLFAAPFATLTPEQREAVETWCPPGLEIDEPRAAYEAFGEARLRGMAKDEAGDEADADAEAEANAADAEEDAEAWDEEVPFEEADPEDADGARAWAEAEHT
ncbi:ParB family chromosome partitioning protein [Palleronia aestuarii]|uniref:ParB family chromosome partitioning protein n=1 Tax=Palleronia aestuarii TaxID=568105 RepID=A0A2W7N1H1_9RHOB|nr:ParB/RepB/Spo0J family partition protein [Palleronia aestuarii]PZX14235.1 ParB family chromosome partitioning protein [Palleronia aestuarii]